MLALPYRSMAVPEILPVLGIEVKITGNVELHHLFLRSVTE